MGANTMYYYEISQKTVGANAPTAPTLTTALDALGNKMVYCISKLCQVQPISPYNLGYCMYFNSKPVSKVYFYFVLRANIRISHPIKI